MQNMQKHIILSLFDNWPWMGHFWEAIGGLTSRCPRGWSVKATPCLPWDGLRYLNFGAIKAAVHLIRARSTHVERALLQVHDRHDAFTSVGWQSEEHWPCYITRSNAAMNILLHCCLHVNDGRKMAPPKVKKSGHDSCMIPVRALGHDQLVQLQQQEVFQTNVIKRDAIFS